MSAKPLHFTQTARLDTRTREALLAAALVQGVSASEVIRKAVRSYCSAVGNSSPTSRQAA